jgi:hypothetical protein
LAILFRPFDFIAHKTLNYLAVQSFDDKGRHTVEDIVKAIVEQDHPNFEDLLRTDELLNCLLHGKKKIKTDIKFSKTHCQS